MATVQSFRSRSAQVAMSDRLLMRASGCSSRRWRPQRLTTMVSPEAFADAVARLQQRATASESLGGESPELPPRRLFGDTAADASSEASGAAGAADAASEAGSEPARSYASTVDWSDASVRTDASVRSGEPLWVPDTEPLWPGGPLAQDADLGGFQLQAEQNAGANEATEPEGSVRSGSSGRPRRRGRRRRGRGNGQGSGLAGGRDMQCDVCDLGSNDPQWCCTAADMLQQRSIQTIVEKHQHKLRTARGSARDPDRREARYAMYRGVITWSWSDPLGAENRVRLPMCVMKRIRRMFPNPICGPGCDFGVECERRGHYVGFRTVAESRAIREGRGEHYDLR